MYLRTLLPAFLLSVAYAVSAPTVTFTSPTPGTTVSTLTSVSITFSEAVAGVDAADLEINGEAASGVTGSGAGPYVFTFTQPPSGSVSVAWEFDHGIAGLGTGAFSPGTGWSYTLSDSIAPTIGKIRTTVAGQEMDALAPQSGATVSVLTQAEVTFSEIVTGVDAADLRVNGTPTTAVTGSGAGPYVFTFPQPANGSITFSWVASPGIVDAATNAFVPPVVAWTVTLAASPGTVVINEFLAANATGQLDENNDAEDWIELHNPGTTSVNLVGWSLTDDAAVPDKWILPSRTLSAGGYLRIFASSKDRKPVVGNLHTNFNLRADNGSLYLFPPNSPRGTAATAFAPYPTQRYNYSYGPQTGGALRYFATPTPAAANGTSSLTGVSPNPKASVSRGFFKESFTLHLSCSDPSATIRYTLNGSDPLATSTAYTSPLTVDKTTILRMASFGATTVPSETVTHSYIYLDSVVTQPSPPYDNPAFTGDEANPPLPTVSGVPVGSGGQQFPAGWGIRSGQGFPGLITNLATNEVPADYGMDPEVLYDPTKYADNGAVDPVNGKTNLQRVQLALRELPILSIVIKHDDFFGMTNGLYMATNVTNKAFAEKPCSVELLLPDGTTGFATTCGIRVHGNASRSPENNPKHGFKLNFKGSFGASKLNYKLFPDSPVGEFDDIILRADYNSSWLHWDPNTQRPKGTRQRDAFCKETFRDMGRAAGSHCYVNLFINGIYWGTYDPTEQQNDGFAASYFGGSKDEYDVIDQGFLNNGTFTAYNAMKTILGWTGSSSATTTQSTAPASGLPAFTNAEYESIKQYLDVPWFIDYTILHFYVGHEDWGTTSDYNKNWYAVRRNTTNGLFRYLPWDMENLLWSETVNRVTGATFPPTAIHTRLVTNAQYRLDFADLVHKHMVAPNGALLPAASTTRWNRWRDRLLNALVAESARWGDYRRDVHQRGTAPLYTWNTHAIAEHNRLNTNYFPARTANVLVQLRNANLYPTLNSPEIRNNATNTLLASQQVAPGTQIKLNLLTPAPGGTTSTGTIYYTTDGADPRVYFDTTGARTPTAQAYTAPITINSTTTIKARCLNGTTWSALNEVTLTVGDTITPVRITEIHYNPPSAQGGSSAEFIEFQNISSGPVDLSGWSMSGVEFVFPSGTVLNGGDRLVIANNNNPAIFATQFPGVSLLGYFAGSLDNSGERLALLDRSQRTVTSVDYDDALPWPTTPDGGGYSLENILPNGDPNSPYHWRASLALKGTPGTANGSTTPQSVRISEFLAVNNGAYTLSGANPGYVELHNTGATTVDISNWSIRSAALGTVTLSASTTLAPGARLLIHATSAAIVGPRWTGSLPTIGDTIGLVTATGIVVDGVRFGPQIGNYSFSKIGGIWTLATPTPGSTETAAATAPMNTLRINEWLANPVPGHDDWLEITNPHTTLPVSLEGLHIGTSGELARIFPPSAVAANGYLRLYCSRGTNRPDCLHFNLPASGTTIRLINTLGETFDTLTYGAQAEDISQGRLPNATGAITTLPYPSPGIANYTAITGQPQLNEILLRNLDGINAPWGRRPAWLEIYNPTGGSVSLAGWQLRNPRQPERSWAFPSGSSIAAVGYLTLWADENEAPSTTASSHMNYSLPGLTTSPLWEGVELVNAQGQIVDRVLFGQQLIDRSIGRPGNSSAWALLSTPTRGSMNAGAAALGPVSALRINEWFASSTALNFDTIELYNTSALPVALGGLYLSDEPSEMGRRKYAIPALSFIEGQGFTVFQADSSATNSTFTGYNLSASGEYLRLAQSNDSVIDVQGFGLQSPSTSQGRQPDGSAAIATFARTTGLANVQGTGPWFTTAPVSQVVRAGNPLTLQANAINATSLQWHRNGVPIAGATSSSLLIPAATSADDGSYTVVASGPGGTLTSIAGVVTVLHTYTTWAAEKGVGGAGQDADFDGISNGAEFIANTDPLHPASHTERQAIHAVGALEFSGNTPTFLNYEFRIQRRAAYRDIQGQMTDNLTADWNNKTPDYDTTLSTEPNGDRRVRWKFSIPALQTRHFLRLQLIE